MHWFGIRYDRSTSSSSFLVNAQRENVFLQVVAGNGTAGYNGDNQPATSAQLSLQYGSGSCVYGDGNGTLYVGDRDNYRLRKIDLQGIITTIAGTGSFGSSGSSGSGTSISFASLLSVTGDTMGSFLYFSDVWCVWKYQISNGFLSRYAGAIPLSDGYSGDGQQATTAVFYVPSRLSLSTMGLLYISDRWNNRIRVVAINGIITTFAGSGPNNAEIGSYGGDGGSAVSTNCKLNRPFAVYADTIGNVFISDAGNSRIRKVDSSGIIRTFAGGGTVFGNGGQASSASLSGDFYDVKGDRSGNIYFPDEWKIRMVNTAGIITTIAGTGTFGTTMTFSPATSSPIGTVYSLWVNSNLNVFFTEYPGLIHKTVNVPFPTSQPSSQPFSHPSLQPFSHPSSQPSSQPFSHPSSQPSSQPFTDPSSQPSSNPSLSPTTFKGCNIGERFIDNGGTSKSCEACVYPYTTLTNWSSSCNSFCLCWENVSYIALGLNIFLLLFISFLIGWNKGGFSIFILFFFPSLDVFTDIAYIMSVQFLTIPLFIVSILALFHPFPLFLYKLFFIYKCYPKIRYWDNMNNWIWLTYGYTERQNGGPPIRGCCCAPKYRSVNVNNDNDEDNKLPSSSSPEVGREMIVLENIEVIGVPETIEEALDTIEEAPEVQPFEVDKLPVPMYFNTILKKKVRFPSCSILDPIDHRPILIYIPLEFVYWTIAVSVQILYLMYWFVEPIIINLLLPFWFVVGVYLESSKVLVSGRIWNFWVKGWCGLEDTRFLVDDSFFDTDEYNSNYIIQFVVESLPQLVIQIINNGSSWSSIAYLSITLSILMTISTVGDRLYTRFFIQMKDSHGNLNSFSTKEVPIHLYFVKQKDQDIEMLLKCYENLISSQDLPAHLINTKIIMDLGCGCLFLLQETVQTGSKKDLWKNRNENPPKTLIL
jgi:hypothetical protein